ncbi:MAG TPA: VIT1/CCC1 transporter family protein [Candidatus Saccharimonadia bacterium]
MTATTDNSARSRKLETAQSGTARAALLGISDGLVTNVSLILGVAATGVDPSLVRIAGVASLIAGAISMAVGEYISMRGQVELLTSILDAERAELHRHPDNVHNQLTSILIGDGVTEGTAHNAAVEIARHPEKAMSMYARGRLGINPDELGSAWGSAISSFGMFAAGAAIPLAPWFLAGAGARPATLLSLSLSALAALSIGAYLGLNTNGRWVRSALRQLLVLILAAGATYLVGILFHVNVA